MNDVYEHLVIRASAGTGKTFQLSNRYLGLAAAGQKLDSILATTFTRKAAGEILDRVLFRLADAALDDSSRRELSGFIIPSSASQSNAPDELTRSDTFDLLRRMIRRLHRLRISTLDSFFIQVARTFALELGLPPGWSIIDEIDDQRLRIEAVREVLTSESTDDVVRLMHLLTKGEVARSVTEQIIGLVNGLLTLYQEAPEQAWQRLKRLKPLDPEQLERAISVAAGLEMPKHKSFVKGRDQNVQHALTDDWAMFVSKGLASKIIAGEESYYRKEITGEMVDGFTPLIGHARAVLLNQVGAQTEATRDLLARFNQTYRRLKLDRRSIRFEDVTRMLLDKGVFETTKVSNRTDATGTKTGVLTGVESVVFRLDGQVEHLLLDEFQDTSPAQWSVLRPFAHDITGTPLDAGEQAAGNTVNHPDRDSSFFCVGDVKQAIYGWRGGVAEIFDTIESELTGLSRETLNKSFRSSRPVIETVNRIFGSLERNESLDKNSDAARRWSLRFEPHDTARDSLPGYCELMTAPEPELPQSDDTDDARDVANGKNGKDSKGGKKSKPKKATKSQQKIMTLRHTADLVVRLSLAMPDRSIGILVRKNDTVGRLIGMLRSLDVEASEEGGNPLTDSPAVTLVLSLLTLGDHPGDRAARFHVATSAFAQPVGLTDHDHRGMADRVASMVRRTVALEGYGPAVRRWAAMLAPVCDARDVSRLEQLVELAYAYDPQATSRVDDFVHFVRNRRVESPTSAKVRVMTVHQSKGLQFDTVVLPELDEKLTGQTPPVVVGRPDPTAPVERVCRYVGEDIRKLMPEPFIRMFDDHTRHIVEESLCVLYVALTRAIHGLYLIVPPSSSSEKAPPATMAGLLRCALADAAPAPPSTSLFQHGDPNWIDRLADESCAKHGDTESDDASANTEVRAVEVRLADPDRDSVASHKAARSFDRVSPSQLEGGAKIHLADRLRFDAGQGMKWGTAVHVLFEQVGWADQTPLPDDETLRRIVRPLVGSSFDPDQVIGYFRSAVSKPAMRGALSRSLYTGSGGADRIELYQERPFVLRNKPSIIRGSIDRLVIEFNADRPVRADLIDFKTDAIPKCENPEQDAAAVQQRVELYRPQLATYRDAVRQMYGLKAQQIRSRLLFISRDLIVDL